MQQKWPNDNPYAFPKDIYGERGEKRPVVYVESKEPLRDAERLPGASRGSFKNSVSLDQIMAEKIGGGFKHAAHLAFDSKKNYPLSNLYISLLQRLGLEMGSFSSGTGTMRGLEMP